MVGILPIQLLLKQGIINHEKPKTKKLHPKKRFDNKADENV